MKGGGRLPLTVVLVSYNKADVIGAAIGSIAAGSLAPDLLVVADDGSDDGTLGVARETATRLGLPCRLVAHPRAGPYRLQTMRNSAIANALEGVVVVSDSDCIFGPFALETHLAIHGEHRLAVGTGPRFEYLSGAAGPFQTTFATLEASHYPDCAYPVPVGANLSFKKSLWRLLGGFDRIYEGDYGMDEFEFSYRAESIGARCISDPGAYLFHIPHGTIFGGRVAEANMALFDRIFGTRHSHDEWLYYTRRVIPWYWQGNRKPPLLGDRVELDRWGAPAGFQPPARFELMRSLAPLTTRVGALLASRDRQLLPELWRFIGGIDGKLVGPLFPFVLMLEQLRWILSNRVEAADFHARLAHWQEGALALEGALATEGEQ